MAEVWAEERAGGPTQRLVPGSHLQHVTYDDNNGFAGEGEREGGRDKERARDESSKA